MKTNLPLRVYYSSCVKIFGTQREKDEYNFLLNLYPKLICPNIDFGKSVFFPSFLKLVKWSNLVIISEFEEHITCGIFHEIKKGNKHDIPVMVIRQVNDSFKLFELSGVSIVNSKDLAGRFAKVSVK